MIKEAIDFSELMKYWRQLNGYTQKDAFEIFGRNYQKWEQSKHIPPKTKYQNIADKTGFTVEEIKEACDRSHFKEEHKGDAYKYNIKNPVAAKKLIEKKAHETVEEVHTEPSESFDTLLLQYADKLKEKETLMKDWLDIKDKLDSLKTELENLKTKIRSAA